MNLKLSQQLGDGAQLSARLTYVHTVGAYVQRGNNTNGIMLGGLRTPPEFDNLQYLDTVYHLHRSYRFPNPDPASVRMTRGFDNPFFSIYEEPNTSALQRMYGNLDFNWAANNWLTLQWTPGFDMYFDARSMAAPWATSDKPQGYINLCNFQNFIVSSILTLSGQHTFDPEFSGSFALGSELNATSSQQLQQYSYTLLSRSR